MKTLVSVFIRKIASGFEYARDILKGKKREIAIVAQVIARLTKPHTVAGHTADFLTQNLDYISLGFDAVSGLFGFSHFAEKAMDNKDKIKNAIGLRRKKNEE